MLQNYYQNNLYGPILKDNLKLKYNLENYLYNNKYSLFKNVQYWETMLNMVGDLWINLGKGVIYSTHYMEEAENICDRVILVNRGKIIATGTPDDILKKTKTNNLRDAFFALIGGEKNE
jgi:ABC-type oligopeptide transport system ATPase subunit